MVTAARIAALQPTRDIGIAIGFRDVDLAAPIEPRKAKLAMPRGGSDCDFFITRPAGLFPIALVIKNEQIIVVIGHGMPSTEP